MSEISEKVVRAWDEFVGLNMPKQRVLTEEERKQIDLFVTKKEKLGWKKRRIKREVRTIFKVNLV